ncbi:MAG: DUF1538 domain-containing protein [Saprospiraceae bacterium]|nr:DUF1538 domain-containing protein [Saprospiraceae bacterium]MCF8251383.1 DUF1538 domain-containing protein [Saprospiraceae bacterium]MCF8283194.1 DUF1538 domain-containing protein [Bacteroidales bacterium]MCF8313224.1 DUF1538 domain-containing protein [Saprospiraceae bacterium]MCF8441671.1 DUF1538 domain-containing protein [Saprospiraceae bacterium]
MTSQRFLYVCTSLTKPALMRYRNQFQTILKKLKEAFKDLLPIIVVVVFFQSVVIRQPFPEIGEVIFGILLVIVGLMLFIEGLEMGLFPIGETMAYALAKKGSLFWLMVFSFALGFSTTIAEPALIAVAKEASIISSGAGLIENNQKTMDTYAMGLRLSVAFSVGLAIVIGVLRILKGWPLYYLIIGGYVLVMLMTIIAPDEIIGLAYDAGGVTTSTITVPLVTALGVGLASVIKGRSPLLDGFGLIAFASLLPMIFVMAYGMFWF